LVPVTRLVVLFPILLVLIRISPEIILGEITFVVVIFLLLVLLFLRLTWWVWDRLNNHGLLIGHLVLLLLPAQIVKLVIALFPLLVLHRSTFIKSSTEPCPLLLHSELGPIAHIAS